MVPGPEQDHKPQDTEDQDKHFQDGLEARNRTQFRQDMEDRDVQRVYERELLVSQ